MINCLPDVGTPADFCGAAGTTLAVVFTWQQIKDSDEEAQIEDVKQNYDLIRL